MKKMAKLHGYHEGMTAIMVQCLCKEMFTITRPKLLMLTRIINSQDFVKVLEDESYTKEP